MFGTHNSRGSVTILVIGVLATLGLMGMVFLLVTNADRKEAAAIKEAVPMRVVAEGQLRRVVNALADDLFINGDNGPFSDNLGLPADQTWRLQRDYPSPDPADYSGARNTWMDWWLSSTEPAQADGAFYQTGRWPKLSNFGPPDPGLFLNVARDASGMVDTDRNGINDSMMFDTGMEDASGRTIFAAIRVVDASAFVNFNTAWRKFQPTAAAPYMPVSMVDLTQLPVAGANPIRLDDIRAARAPGVDDPHVFDTEFAIRPDNPDGNVYRPFDAADALACRWLDSYNFATSTFSPNPAMGVGRLVTALGDDWVAYARYGTTRSATRSLTRRLQGVSYDPSVDNWAAPRAKVGLNLPLNTPEDRLAAFTAWRRAFHAMIPMNFAGLSSDVNTRRESAAQLAVNLIDFLDGDDIPTVAGDVPGERVGGIERQPFITQAWVKVEESGGTWAKRYMAIVMYNPYAHEIDMSDWSVQVGTGATAQTKVLGVRLRAKGRLVIYNDAKIRVAAGTPRVEFSDMNPTDGETVMIVRPAVNLDGTLGENLCMGSFTPQSELPSDPGSIADAGKIFVRLRDDDDTRFRMTVAAYHDEEADVAAGADGGTYDYDTETGSASIGGPNGLAADASGIDTVAMTPVFVRGFGGQTGRMVNIADLDRIFHVGPTDDRPLDRQLSGGASSIANMRLSSVAPPVFSDAQGHPKLPLLCLAADFFTANDPLTDSVDNDGDGQADPGYPAAGPTFLADLARWNREMVVFGKININTVPLNVLMALPAHAERVLPGPVDQAKWRMWASELIAYRDQTASFNGCRDYTSGRSTALGTTDDFRQEAGFAADGELAFLQRTMGPIADYRVAYRVGAGDTDDGFMRPYPMADLTKQDMSYAYTSNLVTVRSDVFCAYITVLQLDEAGQDPNEATVKRHYVAIIDRGNCYTSRDRPVIRAFAEIK